MDGKMKFIQIAADRMKASSESRSKAEQTVHRMAAVACMAAARSQLVNAPPVWGWPVIKNGSKSL
jgi:hypothetical protein